MNRYAIITSLLTVPGLGTRYDPSTASEQPAETVSIGLRLDDKVTVWSECELPLGETAVQTIETIQTSVASTLQGAALDDFRTLAATVDSLQESYVVERILPLPDSFNKANPIMSRRGFLRGLESKPVPIPEPVIERETKERPLASHLRLALSLVLLDAFCLAKEMSPATLLAEAYGFEGSKTAVGIHLSLGSSELAVTTDALKQHVTSVGYFAPKENPAALLGKQGKDLQKYARELKSWFSSLGNKDTPSIYLATHGGIGTLFENKSGLSFGLLYGIGMAIQPFMVRFEDPVLLDERDAHIKEIAKLKSYLKRRRTKVQIVAAEWLDSLEDVQAFLDAEAVHMLHLNLQRLGSISQLMEAIAACREHEVLIMLSDGKTANPNLTRLLAQIACATQAELVTTQAITTGDMGLSMLHNEMQRILTEHS
ncbi:MAG: enolase C-terminal domain-like protein [Chloroflexota bacterium]